MITRLISDEDVIIFFIELWVKSVSQLEEKETNGKINHCIYVTLVYLFNLMYIMAP